MELLFSRSAINTLDRIYTDRGIYDRRQHFVPWFIQWNYIFHQYVRESALDALTPLQGVYNIGRLGVLTYYIYFIGELKCFVIQDFSFPSFRFTSSHVPPVVASDYSYLLPRPFVLPQGIRLLNSVYYGGLKVAYYKRRYVILKSDGTPFVERWLNKKPIFFKKPFGPYNVIAHVSYNNMLYAIDVNGQMYDLNRMWNDTYIRESFAHMIDILVNERLKSYKSKLLYESRGSVIRINESQICLVIQSIVNRLIA